MAQLLHKEQEVFNHSLTLFIRVCKGNYKPNFKIDLDNRMSVFIMVFGYYVNFGFYKNY